MVSTIKRQSSMTMSIAYSGETGTGTWAAGEQKGITTSFSLTGKTVNGFVPIYSGNPKCLITNIWNASGYARFTVFNPTSESQTINHAQARIGVLYTA